MCPRQPRHSMLLLALPTTPAVFSGTGFLNPDQAWAHALKDDRVPARCQLPNRHPKRHNPCCPSRQTDPSVDSRAGW
jgi:hypothetical protein